MHFRVEGEDLNPPVLFTAGTFVTVERQGEEARVGLVKQLNPDGTYHVVSDLTAKVNKALSTFPLDHGQLIRGICMCILAPATRSSI